MRFKTMAVLAMAGGIGCVLMGTTEQPPVLPIDTLPRVAVTHFNFVTLRVADMARALRFYSEALHMHERGRGQPDLRNYEVIVGYDDVPTGTAISLTYRDGVTEPRGNGSSSINLVVTNLREIVDRVVPLGGKITAPVQRVDGRSVAYSSARIEDPDGNALELIEYRRIDKR
jgi:predicted enzyme related to lactoylglutathione lyase